VGSDGRTDLVPGTVVDLSAEVIGLSRADGTAGLMPPSTGGPPERLDGHTIGFGSISSDNLPPHAGEMHPDGDEVLVMASGCIEVALELPDGPRTVRVGAGEALVVPRGVWHLIRCVEPGQLLNITPGPSGEYRPLPAAD
jgi:mannose-6-phosphate isomerase-like protein (cupin superfamily)